jgi:cytochrome c-type biogenesis protein CcmH
MRSTNNRRIVAVLLLALFFTPAMGFSLTSSEVEGEFMCDCGCGDVLVNCTCDRSEEMRAIINGMIKDGMTKDQIIDDFVSQFGEVILSSPPPRGFNLVAYAVPMTGLLLGAVIAVVLVRRWSSHGREEDWDEDPRGDDVDEEGVSDEMSRKIDEELDRMEES